ncbi:heme-binding protein [Roseomonas sp. CECT 9278]|uniref:heme-binding protein n=1 Tax=Roseomonas sp. CECT 9278 TaxID=2845823 RepID=UPI0021118E31|nr:heme-binding protein [Roseomonas sp. CECT 9278]
MSASASPTRRHDACAAQPPRSAQRSGRRPRASHRAVRRQPSLLRFHQGQPAAPHRITQAPRLAIFGGGCPVMGAGQMVGAVGASGGHATNVARDAPGVPVT